jgi:CDP-diglyceride synthetase
MAVLAAVVVGIVTVVFSRQREILEFFSPTTAIAKLLAAAVLMIVVPLFAAVYGTLTTSLLKRFHLE